MLFSYPILYLGRPATEVSRPCHSIHPAETAPLEVLWIGSSIAKCKATSCHLLKSIMHMNGLGYICPNLSSKSLNKSTSRSSSSPYRVNHVLCTLIPRPTFNGPRSIFRLYIGVQLYNLL